MSLPITENAGRMDAHPWHNPMLEVDRHGRVDFDNSESATEFNVYGVELMDGRAQAHLDAVSDPTHVDVYVNGVNVTPENDPMNAPHAYRAEWVPGTDEPQEFSDDPGAWNITLISTSEQPDAPSRTPWTFGYVNGHYGHAPDFTALADAGWRVLAAVPHIEVNAIEGNNWIVTKVEG